MSEPKLTDPVTHMQLREYLLKYVPVEELANYPTLVSLADAMEGVATVEELQAQGRDMMATFVAKYEEREERFRDFTLQAWAAAIRHEMHEADTQLRRETKTAIDNFSADIASQFRAYEERMRDFLRALMDPHHGVPERVTGLEARVERLEAKVLAPKRSRRRSSR